jgi:hypothetical protein
MKSNGCLRLSLRISAYLLCTGTFFFDVCSAQSWQPLGTNGGEVSFGDAWGYYPSIAIDTSGAPIVGLSNPSGIVAKKLISNSWSIIGIPSTTYNGGTTSIAVDKSNNTYIGFLNSTAGKPTVIKYDGTGWSTIGSPISYNGTIAPGTTCLQKGIKDTLYFGYASLPNGSAGNIMKFDGTDWVQMGNTSFMHQAQRLKLAVDTGGVLYAAYDFYPASLGSYIRRFNGTDWDTVVSHGPSAHFMDITFDSNNDLYILYSTSTTVIKKLVNNSWVNLGVTNVDPSLEQITSIVTDKNNRPYFSFSESNNGFRASVKVFDGTSWNYLGSKGFSPTTARDTRMAFSKDKLCITYAPTGMQYQVYAMYYDISLGVSPVVLEGSKVKVYPNPVTGRHMHIEAHVLKKGSYTITLVNALGQGVYQSSYTYKAGTPTIEIDLKQQLPEGVYHLDMTNGESRYSETITVGGK